MIQSNFIDEQERHTELFFTFTTRQVFIIRMIQIFNNQRINDDLIRFYLLLFVTKEEIHWLERTGWITSRCN